MNQELGTSEHRSPRDLNRPTEAAGFRSFIGTGWGLADRDVRLPEGLAKAAEQHRAKLSEALPGKRIAVAAGRAPVRSNDTDYEFRADSDFVWLSGCQAEGSVLVMEPSGGGHDAVLYLRRPARAYEIDFFANARDGELWIGPVPGLEEWSTALGIACRPVEDLATALRGQARPVMATTGVEPMLDALTSTGPAEQYELRRILAELRRIKDSWEIDQLREAVAATVLGFGEVARELPEAVRGGGERWLQGTFDRRARTSGNGPGYASIVAAGRHSPVLHWTRCDGAVPEDGVLLLDAGVETRTLYTADITRTLPVSGTFSPAQRKVYELVHSAHLTALEEIKPGALYQSFHNTAMRVLAEGLHDWGLLPVSPDEALDPDGQQHRRYIVCGVSHFLGLDVHDCASSSPPTYKAGSLEAGMAMAVEPGLYFHPNDETVPPELRGLGVRIEDNIVVRESGYELLTGDLPRTPDALQEWTRARL